MKGITFGAFHSYNDLQLILTAKEIGCPEVKVKKIDIDGADGSLDYTDFFGEPKYSDVTHKFQFSTIVPQKEFLTLFSTIKNALHGKKLRIILDDDPLFYYVGRCHVSSFTNQKNIGIIAIECDCEPWKYKLANTVITQTITGSGVVTLPNGRKRVVPEIGITAEAALRIIFDQVNIWDLGSGSYRLPELELTEGANTVDVTGTGTITFTYQQADL